MSDTRIDKRTDAYDPTRVYEDRPECKHFDPPAVAKAPTPLPPNLPDASFGPLPKPMRMDISSVRRAAPDAPPPRSDIQVRLDEFLERATPRFTAEGKDVAVRIPFRMTMDAGAVNDPRNAGNAWVIQERTVQANERELTDAANAAKLSADDINRLHEGRATPEQIRAVTQALIDGGHLPPSSPHAPDLPMRIRQMMYDHGIGLDCAGFVQQDHLASRGLTRRDTGLDPNIGLENLANLQGKGFARVPVGDARSGDLFILDPPGRGEVGHTMMVYDHRDATAEELAELRKQPGFASGRVTAYVLDSSYGSETHFDVGGVMRQIWWRDEETKTWARKTEDIDPDGRKIDDRFEVWAAEGKPPAERVYGPDGHRHSIDGVYRPRGETR